MGRRKFKECERGVIRETIIDAAAKVAKEHSLHCLTLRMVAKEAGYCPASIYEYFSDKEALLVAMTVQTCNQLHERLSKLPQTNNAGNDLLAMMQETINFHIQFPESCDLFSSICFGPNKAPLPEFEQSVGLFANCLRRLESPQLHTKEQINNALDILRIILIGSTTLISQQHSRCAKAIATNAVEVLLNGWKIARST
jgi:AcrR family transcriptional regulator